MVLQTPIGSAIARSGTRHVLHVGYYCSSVTMFYQVGWVDVTTLEEWKKPYSRMEFPFPRTGHSHIMMRYHCLSDARLLCCWADMQG